jgi:hypothetical protein
LALVEDLLEANCDQFLMVHTFTVSLQDALPEILHLSGAVQGRRSVIRQVILDLELDQGLCLEIIVGALLVWVVVQSAQTLCPINTVGGLVAGPVELQLGPHGKGRLPALRGTKHLKGTAHLMQLKLILGPIGDELRITCYENQQGGYVLVSHLRSPLYVLSSQR